MLTVEPDATRTTVTYAWDASTVMKMLDALFIHSDKDAEDLQATFKREVEVPPCPQQFRFPRGQARRSPVAVGPANTLLPILGDLHQQLLQMLSTRVVRIDQRNGQPGPPDSIRTTTLPLLRSGPCAPRASPLESDA